jgi:hypothetical protein
MHSGLRHTLGYIALLLLLLLLLALLLLLLLFCCSTFAPCRCH